MKDTDQSQKAIQNNRQQERAIRQCEEDFEELHLRPLVQDGLQTPALTRQ
jgi:hypothetical protein